MKAWAAGRLSRRDRAAAAASAAIFIACFGAPLAQAETISGALAKAYGFSPDLGQQRAATRAADEGVAKATSGYRPTLTATASAGAARTITDNPLNTVAPKTDYGAYPRSAGVSVSQTLYNGNRATNSVRQAESSVLQSREALRLSELGILNAAAAAYMNVLRDTALLRLNQSNIEVLRQQLNQTSQRFTAGEVTRTDVAQAQAALANGEAGASTARANLQNSLGVYRQLIGEAPKNLTPARGIDGLLPKGLDRAIEIAQSEHPSIQAALHAVDVAALNVKIQEGALYPTVSVQGNVSRALDANGLPRNNVTTLSAMGVLSIPIYDGGLSYASIRQSKELLGQARLQAGLQREAIRSAVVSAWGALQSAKASIRSFQASVRANEMALAGIREEAKVGQRTTLDVLNAQQALLAARTSLVTAQRDQVVNTYALAAAVGQLSATRLGLRSEPYDPTIHFDQTKNRMFGSLTPDGR